MKKIIEIKVFFNGFFPYIELKNEENFNNLVGVNIFHMREKGYDVYFGGNNNVVYVFKRKVKE